MRGWTLDVYNQITHLPTQFSLKEAYTSEEQLAKLHPENKHIKPKIRQQLQILRDIGLLEFRSRGVYKLQQRTHQSKLF
jgi:type II restriction enzyme